MKTSIFIMIAAIGLLIGCRADQIDLPKQINYPILDGTWYLKTKVISGTEGSLIILPDTTTAFTKNDYYKFNTDNTVNYSSSTSTTISTFYYSLVTTQSGQTLNIGSTTNGYSNTPYTVNKLTKDSLILYNSVTSLAAGAAITINTTAAYTH